MKPVLASLLLGSASLFAQTVIVKPYIQPGDASGFDSGDSRVFTWITDKPAEGFRFTYTLDGISQDVPITSMALDFAKPLPPPKPSTPPAPNTSTNTASQPAVPQVSSPAPSQPVTSLDQLKRAVIDAFPAITEREQLYVRHRAIVSGLPFDQSFRWKVSDREGGIIREGVAKTRTRPGTATRFVAVGDMASNKPEAFVVAHHIASVKPDFLIALGDIVYPSGRAIQYMNHFFPVYNDVSAPSPRTGAPLMASIPFYPVIGNHDADAQRLPAFADAYSCFHWFSVPKNGPGEGPWNVPLGNDAAMAAAFRKMAGSEYPAMSNYSFDQGDGHFLVLDANSYAGKELDALIPWIEKDLSGSKQRWKFVSFHQPAFHTSKEHYTEQRMRLLQPLFERTGVDVVLAGHVHNYQRSMPLRFVPGAEGRDKRGRVNGTLTLDRTFDGVSHTRPDGVIHIVSGGGGAKLYSVDLGKTVEQLIKDHPDNYQPLTAKYVAEHGFTIVDMTADSLHVQQMNADGKIVDSIRITK